MDDKRQIDDRLREMLRDLGKALSEAISDSYELSHTLKRIRDEGYALYLLVDNREDGEGADAEPVELAVVGSEKDVSFRINGDDLSFLRSLGIDPTRALKKRRPE